MKVTSFSYDNISGWEHLDEASALDSKKTLVFAFFAPELVDDKKAFQPLFDKFPNSRIVGCTTSGEIHSMGVKDESISCSAIQLTHSHFKAGITPINDANDSFKIGEQIKSNLMADDLKGIYLLCDGTSTNGTDLSRGVTQDLDSHVIVSGGLAGDGSRFEKTYVLDQNQFLSGHILSVGFYGESLNFHHGSKGGWDIFGPKRKVTKSKGNELFEIDGKPALALYKEYLGEKAADLPSSGLFFPLEISWEGSDKALVRTILGINEEKQSLIYAGDVPEGANAQFMKANFDSLIDGAESASLQAMHDEDNNKDGDTLTLAVSCVGRRMVLGPRSDDEVDAVNDSIKNQPMIGYYSYGELSPTRKGEPCELHNQSMTILHFYEKKAA